MFKKRNVFNINFDPDAEDEDGQRFPVGNR